MQLFRKETSGDFIGRRKLALIFSSLMIFASIYSLATSGLNYGIDFKGGTKILDVGTGGGFILLTGEVGTGKTTINRCLMQQLPGETDVAIILNPALNAEELLATVVNG